MQAEIYAVGEGRVLRRALDGSGESESEARLLRYLREHRFPVPDVYRAEGDELEMQRVEGVTLLTAIARRPWRIRSHARILARLHRRLHAIEPPEWLPPLDGHQGGVILHLDLHPRNVLLTRRGPMVIDWGKARRGPAAIDVAMTWLILESAMVPGGPIARRLSRWAGRFVAQRFLIYFDKDDVARATDAAAAFRLADADLGPRERERVLAIRERMRVRVERRARRDARRRERAARRGRGPSRRR
jgi:Ser/Thr protein kinase RdoA (MazF antagonist)